MYYIRDNRNRKYIKKAEQGEAETSNTFNSNFNSSTSNSNSLNSFPYKDCQNLNLKTKKTQNEKKNLNPRSITRMKPRVNKKKGLPPTFKYNAIYKYFSTDGDRGPDDRRRDESEGKTERNFGG